MKKQTHGYYIWNYLVSLFLYTPMIVFKIDLTIAKLTFKTINLWYKVCNIGYKLCSIVYYTNKGPWSLQIIPMEITGKDQHQKFTLKSSKM